MGKSGQMHERIRRCRRRHSERASAINHRTWRAYVRCIWYVSFILMLYERCTAARQRGRPPSPSCKGVQEHSARGSAGGLVVVLQPVTRRPPENRAACSTRRHTCLRGALAKLLDQEVDVFNFLDATHQPAPRRSYGRDCFKCRFAARLAYDAHS